MAGKGAAKGTRNGGRHKGIPNRTTTERALQAQRDVDAAKSAGRKLGKEVLDEFMHVFGGMAARLQQKLHVAEAGGDARKAELAELKSEFERWARLAVHCAEKLSPYQSPTFRAIVVAPAPETNQTERVKRITLRIFDAPPTLQPPGSKTEH